MVRMHMHSVPIQKMYFLEHKIYYICSIRIYMHMRIYMTCMYYSNSMYVRSIICYAYKYVLSSRYSEYPGHWYFYSNIVLYSNSSLLLFEHMRTLHTSCTYMRTTSTKLSSMHCTAAQRSGHLCI